MTQQQQNHFLTFQIILGSEATISKFIKQTVNKSKYANFFTNRVVNTWNKLPSHIVNAKSINEFKNLFDEHNKDNQ